MSQEKDYVFSRLSKEADQERLSALELAWDPTTIRHMEMLGVSSGWKCLDVGGGFGSITRWLEERVRPEGTVVTTELRPELQKETGDVVEIRQHNILTDELETNYYNLVHCRLLLEHLNDPEKALTNMARAVKPGGWLLIEELDGLIRPVFDSLDDDADFYYKFLHKASGIQIRLRYFDVEFGRKVRKMIEGLEFQDVDSEGTTRIIRGCEPLAQWDVMSYKALVERLKDEFIEEEQKLVKEGFDRLINLLENPSFYFVSSPLFSAWGRKPN